MQARRDAKEQARRDRLAAEEAERVLVSHFASQTRQAKDCTPMLKAGTFCDLDSHLHVLHCVTG